MFFLDKLRLQKKCKHVNSYIHRRFPGGHTATYICRDCGNRFVKILKEFMPKEAKEFREQLIGMGYLDRMVPEMALNYGYDPTPFERNSNKQHRLEEADAYS